MCWFLYCQLNGEQAARHASIKKARLTIFVKSNIISMIYQIIYSFMIIYCVLPRVLNFDPCRAIQTKFIVPSAAGTNSTGGLAASTRGCGGLAGASCSRGGLARGHKRHPLGSRGCGWPSPGSCDRGRPPPGSRGRGGPPSGSQGVAGELWELKF